MKEKYIKNINNKCTFSKNGFDVIIPSIKNNDISICFLETTKGRDNYCLLDKSTIFYYIIDGKGYFEIDNEIVEVSNNDLIEISPKSKYSYSGHLKMLEIQSSAFDESEVHEFPKEKYNGRKNDKSICS